MQYTVSIHQRYRRTLWRTRTCQSCWLLWAASYEKQRHPLQQPSQEEHACYPKKAKPSRSISWGFLRPCGRRCCLPPRRLHQGPELHVNAQETLNNKLTCALLYRIGSWRVRSESHTICETTTTTTIHWETNKKNLFQTHPIYGRSHPSGSHIAKWMTNITG